MVAIAVAAALTVTKLTSSGITVPAGLFPTTTASGGSSGAATPAAPASIGHAALAAACDADAKSVTAAVQAYTAEIGSPPPDEAALAASSTIEGQTMGPWLRSVPGTSHYTIYVDAHGDVGVYPAHATPTGTVPSSEDYAQHPELCTTVPS